MSRPLPPYAWTMPREPVGPFRTESLGHCQKDGCGRPAVVEVVGPGNEKYGKYCAAHGQQHAAHLNATQVPPR